MNKTIHVKQVDLFKSAMSAISKLANEARFDIRPQGITLFALDAAKVSAINFAWELEELATETEVLELYIKPQEWIAALKRIKANDEATITVTDEAIVLLLNDGTAKRKFTFAQYEFEQGWKKIPDRLTFDATAKLPSARWLDAVGDAKDYAESTHLVVTDGELLVTAMADNKERFRTELTGNNEMTFTGDANARYSSEYLETLAEFAKKATDVTLSFKTNHPIKIEYAIPSAKMTAILAPRVEQQ